MPRSSSYINNTKFEDFDPNVWVADDPLWGVYVPRRFKTYASRGPALQAVLVAYQAKLYELVGGKWVERAAKPECKPAVCAECGNSTVEARTPHNYGGNYGEYVWRKRGGKIGNPPELVATCRKCRPGVTRG